MLGGAEVKLLEMVSAYSAFANDGVLNPASPILKIQTSNGRVLEEEHLDPRPVIDPEVARTTNDVLSDNNARIGVFQPHSSLYFPDRTVAAKTGTTQDYHDAWTIGYTPSIAVGVWAGNNDNTPIQQKGSGVLAAAPSWHEFMDFALQQFPPEDFISPSPHDVAKPILEGVWQGDTVVTIDTVSGKRATDLTPPETRKDLAYGTPHDPLYWIDRNDPAGPPPANPANDPQYPNWEISFERWLQSSGFHVRSLSEAPNSYDDVHTIDRQPKIAIQRTPGRDPIVLHITSDKPYPLQEIVLVSPDGKIIDSYPTPTLPLDITVPKDALSSDPADFEVRAYDTVKNIGTATISLP